MSARIDFIAYPPTSFPFRDLLVLEQLDLGGEDRVCEIGVGSGGTTARLAKICKDVVGLEISHSTVEALRYLEQRYPNLHFVTCDVTQPEHILPFSGQFSRAIASDTLEHVHDPEAFFRGLGELLAPGGRFLVTFPNESPMRMHGVTRFDTKAQLEAIVRKAGLVPTTIGAAVLTDRANKIAKRFGWGPLRMVRKVVNKKKKRPKNEPILLSIPPQSFGQTKFAKRMHIWRKFSPAINLYWHGVLKLMDAPGPAFEIDTEFKREPFIDSQVVILGKKP